MASVDVLRRKSLRLRSTYLPLPMKHFLSLSNTQDVVACGRSGDSLCHSAPEGGGCGTHTPGGGRGGRQDRDSAVLTLVILCCLQVCVGGFYSSSGARTRAIVWSPLLDLISSLFFIVVIPKPFIHQKHHILSPIPAADNSGCVLRCVMALLSSCRLTSFHSR